MKIRVYYEDVDIGGIVYHSKYLNFCERARSEIFFARGLSPKLGEYHFVVKSLEAHYHRPAFLGDILKVETKLLEIKGAVVRLHQQVEKEQTLCFEMTITLVCMRGSRPARPPREFAEALRSVRN